MRIVRGRGRGGTARASAVAAVAVTAVAGMACVTFLRWWSYKWRTGGMASWPPPAPATIAAASTPELLADWENSRLALQCTAELRRRLRIVVARRAILDELERRDPGGFARWIDAAARHGADPRRHLNRP